APNYFLVLNPIRSLTKDFTMFHNDFSRRGSLGDTHFQQRTVSRRQFLHTSAGLVGAAVGGSLFWPARALARHHVAPRPIPGGVTAVIGEEQFPIHHFPVTGPVEPSEITDLNGHVGDCRVLGTGVGVNTETGEATELLFQADMGFMKGVYVGEDG